MALTFKRDKRVFNICYRPKLQPVWIIDIATTPVVPPVQISGIQKKSVDQPFALYYFLI